MYRTSLKFQKKYIARGTHSGSRAYEILRLAARSHSVKKRSGTKLEKTSLSAGVFQGPPDEGFHTPGYPKAVCGQFVEGFIYVL